MHTETTIHRCESISIANHDPRVGNFIRLRIRAEGDGSTEMALFDLPEEFTDALLAALPRDANPQYKPFAPEWPIDEDAATAAIAAE